MNAEFQVLLAVLVYLCFFAWIGWRRGFKAEITVFIVSIIAWVLLQERGSIFVRIANLGIKFLGLLGTSLATGNVDESAVTGGTDFVQPGSEDAFLFVLWIGLVALAYVITTRAAFARSNRTLGWAAVTGALNGLFFLAVLIPKFNQLYQMIGGDTANAPLRTFVGMIFAFFDFLVQSIQDFWEWVQPLSPTTILIVLTIILSLIALSLRRGNGKAAGG